MALFSFRHSVKTFSEKRLDEGRVAKLGQTAAHLRYISRPQAAREVLQARLTGSFPFEVAQMAEKEAQKRKGRVCERFVVALPVEATPEQRAALVSAFAESLSKGVAGYVAAIHDQHGNDLNNPHAHFVFFDVQQKTGGRGRPKSTLGLARKNAIQGSAKLWADLHNKMMTEWGYGTKSMISHQSYADRGIEKIPTIHEGAASRAGALKKVGSQEKWKRVDSGRSRSEANKVIKEINQLREVAKNAGNDGLGKGDGCHEAERDCGISEQRKRGGRNVPFIEQNRRLNERSGGVFDADGHLAEGARRSSAPFQKSYKARTAYQHHSEASPAINQHVKFNSVKSSEHSKIDRSGDADHFRPGRRVRRVFHELIMLRDTLRARLFRTDGAIHKKHGIGVRKKTEVSNKAMKKPRSRGANEIDVPYTFY